MIVITNQAVPSEPKVGASFFSRAFIAAILNAATVTKTELSTIYNKQIENLNEQLKATRQLREKR